MPQASTKGSIDPAAIAAERQRFFIAYMHGRATSRGRAAVLVRYATPASAPAASADLGAINRAPSSTTVKGTSLSKIVLKSCTDGFSANTAIIDKTHKNEKPSRLYSSGFNSSKGGRTPQEKAVAIFKFGENPGKPRHTSDNSIG